MVSKCSFLSGLNAYITPTMPEAAIDQAYFDNVRVIAARMAHSFGYETFEGPVLDRLTHYVISYGMDLSNRSKHCAEFCGRNNVNVKDVESSLREDNVSLDDLANYIKTAPKIARVNPPKIEPAKIPEVTLKLGEERPMPSYIPSWCPKFPDGHTYMKTAVVSDVELSFGKVRTLQAENKEKTIDSLLHYTLATNENFCLFRQKHNDVLDQAKSELEKQEAALEAKRARYSSDAAAVDMFELKETTTSIVRKSVPEKFFFLKPFRVADPTQLALCQDDDEEPELPNPAENDSLPLDVTDTSYHADDSKMDLDDTDLMEMLSPDSADGN
uniref:Transcription initiation factor TFIID subunit 8 n=1 Tax=Panagrellus redivivus TaxID=6233 RepID=A0A7E4W551_PANRE